MTRNKANDVLKMVLTALFAALICVATMLVQVPAPVTGGYANLGDGVILMGAFLLHPLYAVIAAGLGSMLADMLAGYMAYAPATLMIKALMAGAASLIYIRFGKAKKPVKAIQWMVIAGFAAESIMVLGYFFYEAVIMGFGAAGASASILTNVGQGAVGIAVACVTAPLLMRNSEVKSLMNKTWK